MLLRLLFLLLLALNVGAGAWLLFGPAPAPSLPPATDPGVPALQLMPPRASAVAIPVPVSAATSIVADGHVAVTPAAATTVASDRGVAGAASAAIAATAAMPASGGNVADVCASLGPFMTRADMRAALRTLTPHVARIRDRKVDVARTHGFRVFLPATATRAEALDEGRTLASKGIHDYYVVTAGDAENTVSLGLFDRETNARARVAQLQALGFSAEVKPRVETKPAYRIDYAVPSDAGFEWQPLLPGRGELDARTIECF